MTFLGLCSSTGSSVAKAIEDAHITSMINKSKYRNVTTKCTAFRILKYKKTKILSEKSLSN